MPVTLTDWGMGFITLWTGGLEDSNALACLPLFLLCLKYLPVSLLLGLSLAVRIQSV